MESIVISASYHPALEKWSGMMVRKMPGTHEKYDVVYNGECCNEYHATEKEAKDAAENAYIQYLTDA